MDKTSKQLNTNEKFSQQEVNFALEFPLVRINFTEGNGPVSIGIPQNMPPQVLVDSDFAGALRTFVCNQTDYSITIPRELLWRTDGTLCPDAYKVHASIRWMYDVIVSLM